MAKQAFYAVQVGRVPGVYSTWDECKAQVDGYPGSKYKKFKTDAEAQAFVKGEELSGSVSGSGGLETFVQNGCKSVPESSTDTTLPKGPYAFVDGSFNPETKVYGYGGFVCVNGRKYPIMGNGQDPEMATMRNVAGEIEGAMVAVKKAESLKIRDLTLLYDYKGIEQWAIPAGEQGHWKATKSGTQAYAEFMKPENRLTQIHFQKVAAHTGIEGNEMADVMAKKAVGIALTGPQKALYEKAMNCGRRDGIPGFGEDMDVTPEDSFSL